jgi:glycosyltransferase involved in cell wall biosynthesis
MCSEEPHGDMWFWARSMPDHPLVSVITLTYNHEQFIGTCIKSVLQQTYANWEQIIIDDGSTDDTAKIISNYRDPRIRYERQANRGPFELAKTYNRALSLARGDLIAILEGDDYWPADKLSTLVPAFQDVDVVLAYGERQDIDAQGRKQRRKTSTAHQRENLPDSIFFNSPVGSTTRYMLLEEGRALVHPCTVLMRAEALERIGGFQYVAGLPLTDYPTFLELSLHGKFFFTRRTMGYLRRHQRSITVCHHRTIHEAVSEFAARFLERQADSVALSAVDRYKIENSWRGAEDRLHFSEGRMLLLQKSWSDARTQFRIAARSKSAKVRAAALAGWFMSMVHRDMEPLMRLGGRADLRVAVDD